MIGFIHILRTFYRLQIINLLIYSGLYKYYAKLFIL